MKHGLPAGSPEATHPIGKQKSETRETFTSRSDVFEPVYGAWGGRAHVHHSGKKEAEGWVGAPKGPSCPHSLFLVGTDGLTLLE